MNRRDSQVFERQRFLIDLIQEYQTAGYLSDPNAALEYIRLVQHHPEAIDIVAKQIQQAVRAAQQQPPTSFTTTNRMKLSLSGSGANYPAPSDPPGITGTAVVRTSDTTMMENSPSSNSSVTATSVNHQVSWNDERSLISSASQRDNITAAATTINIAPRTTTTTVLERQKQQPQKQQAPPLCLDPSMYPTYNNTDDDDTKSVQQLFVEMCFFARLGFVQPPCCLHCTYREGMENQPPPPLSSSPKNNSNNDETSSSSSAVVCQRWVVWRKNANQLLHPESLSDNILLFQCHAVRQLLDGQSIEGYRWDANNKQLVVGDSHP